MVEPDQPSVSRLDGEFIVAVGNAVGMEIAPEDAAGVPADADRAFRVTLVAPSLAHTVETVDLGVDGISAAKRTMYMIQRGSSGAERDRMPASYDDPYDVICFIDDWVKSQTDDEWERVFEERKADDRYETTTPSWVADAMNTEN